MRPVLMAAVGLIVLLGLALEAKPHPPKNADTIWVLVERAAADIAVGDAFQSRRRALAAAQSLETVAADTWVTVHKSYLHKPGRKQLASLFGALVSTLYAQELDLGQSLEALVLPVQTRIGQFSSAEIVYPAGGRASLASVQFTLESANDPATQGTISVEQLIDGEWRLRCGGAFEGVVVLPFVPTVLCPSMEGAPTRATLLTCSTNLNPACTPVELAAGVTIDIVAAE